MWQKDGEATRIGSAPHNPLVISSIRSNNLILMFSEAPLIVFVLDMTCILVQYRREVCKILEAACDYFLKSESNSHDSDEIVMASSPWKPTDEKHLHSAMHIYKCSANKFARFCRLIVVTSKSWGTDKPAMTLCRYPRKVQWEATCGIASTWRRGFRSWRHSCEVVNQYDVSFST